MDNDVDVLEVQRSDDSDQAVRDLKHLTPIVPEQMAKERIQWLWDKLRTQDYAFDDVTRNDPRWFLAGLFMPGTEHFMIGDKGYAMAAGIALKQNCLLHFTLWDSMTGTELFAAGREFVSFMLNKYQLNRVTAVIPAHNKQVVRLAVLLGFRFEGELRQCLLYKGEYYNVALYGLLRDEFERREVTH